jgi:hypothetical protein
LISESNIARVLGRDSVPEALINSSILSGLPEEYNADSILAAASFSPEILTILFTFF